ncbi:MAG: YafY family transcriptional regulator [Caulobacterales bacterium]|nr:YafY family transcriptional regulator [Caulobacterales bacterium]MCA0372506.1 YafY family transcriptional regulator [Pseudomonadota bacterium]
MRRADRLLQIIQILRRHRKPVAGSVIARELEVSLRTIYRDIETLMTDGVPITGEAGVGYVLGDGYDLPPLMFKADEIEAIILGLQWIKRRGDDALITAADDAIAKVGTILPKELRPILYDSGLVVPPNFAIEKDNIDVSSVRRAIRTQNKINFDYAREDGTKTNRTIWPIAISYFEKQRLIIAFCELRQDLRSFRTDRANNLVILPEKYRGNRQRLLKEFIEKMRCEFLNQTFNAGTNP